MCPCRLQKPEHVKKAGLLPPATGRLSCAPAKASRFIPPQKARRVLLGPSISGLPTISPQRFPQMSLLRENALTSVRWWAPSAGAPRKRFGAPRSCIRTQALLKSGRMPARYAGGPYYAACRRGGLSLAVVDKSGRIEGIVTKANVLSSPTRRVHD